MCQIYDSLPVQERQRIEKIEMLDEGELLVQLFQHYCITMAWIGELFQDIEITSVPGSSTLDKFHTFHPFRVEKRLSTLMID